MSHAASPLADPCDASQEDAARALLAPGPGTSCTALRAVGARVAPAIAPGVADFCAALAPHAPGACALEGGLSAGATGLGDAIAALLAGEPAIRSLEAAGAGLARAGAAAPFIVRAWSRLRLRLVGAALAAGGTDGPPSALALDDALDGALALVLEGHRAALLAGRRIDDDARRRAAQAEREAALGRMSAGLAHEVRNPLNAAKLQVALLLRRLARAEASPHLLLDGARRTEREIDRLERLTDDFLDFTQAREVERRPVAIPPLCAEVARAVSPLAEAAGVCVRVEAPRTLPAAAGDPDRLHRALVHLVRNAIEATPAGGEATLAARTEEGRLVIDVRDTGPGIPPEAPIFDAFYSTKAFGTGLGLSVVNRVVADHGGAIRVRSRPGATCFSMVLPVAREGARTSVARHPAP